MPQRAGVGPRIVVLGGGGRVGRLLSRALRAADVRRVAVQSRRPGAGIDWASEPDEDMLVAWLRSQVADLTVVLWGATSGNAPELKGNSDLACLAYRAAARAACGSVAAMSSAAVYGAGDGTPFAECATLAPTSPYGVSKREMECDLTDLRAVLGAAAPALSLLRLSNVVGADMLGTAAATARADAPLVLDRFADGHGPRRSYLSPVTLAAVCHALALSPPGQGIETLNIADGEQPVAMDALLEARAAQGAPVPWRWRPAPPGALWRHSLSVDRLRARFPAVAAGFRGNPQTFAADWVDLTEATT